MLPAADTYQGVKLLFDSEIEQSAMDNIDPGKVNKIIWKRSKSEMDANHEMDDPPYKCENEGEKRSRCDSLQLSTSVTACNLGNSFMMPMLSMPKMDEWCLKTSIVLTGTACRGVTGPPVGVVDIGVSKYAYYFCTALPGVKKDPGKPHNRVVTSFSCVLYRFTFSVNIIICKAY